MDALRAPRAAALDPRRLAAVAAALRVLGDLRRVRAEQAARPRLVRRHGHLAARLARARRPPAWLSPTGPSRLLTDRGFHTGAAKADRAHRAVHRARAVVAPHALRGRMGRRDLPPDDRGVRLGAGLLAPRASPCCWSGPCRPPAIACCGSTRARRRARAAVVRSLDWLARFRVEEAPPGSAPEVVDRDGTRLRGGPAVAFTLSRLPLTAWFALPTLLLPAVRRARC